MLAPIKGIRVTEFGVIRAGEEAAIAAERGGITLASGLGGETAPMQVIRTIGKGESLADIINEAKGLTFSSGNEVALVKLASGERALVSGGPRGIEFAEGEITRVFGHTHPYDIPPTGPSDFDFHALQSLGQQSSYLLEHGQLVKFGVK